MEIDIELIKFCKIYKFICFKEIVTDAEKCTFIDTFYYMLRHTNGQN